MKNKHHDVGAGWEAIAEYFTQYTNVTADSNARNIGRFLVVDIDNNKYSNMTEENMADAPWLEDIEQEPELETKIVALIRFLTTLLKVLTAIINGVLSLTA